MQQSGILQVFASLLNSQSSCTAKMAHIIAEIAKNGEVFQENCICWNIFSYSSHLSVCFNSFSFHFFVVEASSVIVIPFLFYLFRYFVIFYKCLLHKPHILALQVIIKSHPLVQLNQSLQGKNDGFWSILIFFIYFLFLQVYKLIPLCYFFIACLF